MRFTLARQVAILSMQWHISSLTTRQFASYYLQRTYFFDVHPPFGKLLFAFAGWLVGYNGDFLFENIGDSYITNKVPYVAYRAMPATMGALTVSVVFMIMWESGYSLPACVLAAGLLLLDNAHIGQTRLILLDATLVLFMACLLYTSPSPRDGLLSRMPSSA